MNMDKMTKLFKNKEFIEKYNSCKTPLEKSELFLKNGLPISEDDIKSLENYIQNEYSLNDNDLQNISGGLKFKPFLKAAATTIIAAAGSAGLVYARGKFLKKKSLPLEEEPTIDITDHGPKVPVPDDPNEHLTPNGNDMSVSPNIFSPANNDEYDDIKFDFDLF